MDNVCFTFYKSFGEALSELAPEDYKDCMTALIAYAIEGEEIASTPVSRMFMSMAKPIVDASNRKREAGRAGGKASGSKTEAPRKQTEANVSKVEAEASNSENLASNNKKKTINNKEKTINNKERHKYGRYGHVLLTDQDLTSLEQEYGKEETTTAIDYLDNYCEANGKSYKNYAQAMRNWVYRAVSERKPKSKPNPFTAFSGQNHYSTTELEELVSN